MKTVNLKANFVGQQSTTHLTEELREDFFSKAEMEAHMEDYVDIDLKTNLSDCYNLVSIDKVLTMLNELKSNGATHVNIDFHCDHDEYNIYGFEVYSEAEKDEAERLAKEEAARKALVQKKIAKLQKDLEKLQNEL